MNNFPGPTRSCADGDSRATAGAVGLRRYPAAEREKARSAHLLGCKRPRYGLRSLPPFPGGVRRVAGLVERSGVLLPFFAGGGNPGGRGGGGRAQRAQRRGRGPLAPAPCVGFVGLGPPGAPAPQNAAAPARTPAAPRVPMPVRFRRPCGGCLGGAGRSGQACGGRRRLAAVGWPCGPPHGLPNKIASPGLKAPGSLFQDASRPAAAPPAGFSANANKAAQTPAPLRPTREKVVAAASLFPRGMARETLSERGTAPVPLRGQSPGPRSTGPGGTARPAAGYGLRPPAPAVARFSPPAQGRRPRRAAVRAGQL